LKRVFKIDIEAVQYKVIARIEDPAVINEILNNPGFLAK